MVKLIYFLLLLYYLPVQSILADGIIKEQSLPTTQGKSLIVKSDCGDVNISTWNKDEAYVKIIGNDNAKNKMEFNIEEKNGDIYINVKKSSGIKHLENTNLKIDISIPEKFNGNIYTAGGDITLGYLTGNIDMKTAGGDIVLKKIIGNANLKTAGGDIRVESFTGDFSAKTAGGDINLKGVNGSVEAKTAGGDVTLRYSGENKGIELSTSGGNISLYLPENFSAKVDLITSSGEIRMGFDYKGKIGKHKSSLKGEIGNGGELVSCKTSGGDIVVDKIK